MTNLIPAALPDSLTVAAIRAFQLRDSKKRYIQGVPDFRVHFTVCRPWKYDCFRSIWPRPAVPTVKEITLSVHSVYIR